MHTCNPRTQEAEAGALQTQGQAGLHRKLATHTHKGGATSEAHQSWGPWHLGTGAHLSSLIQDSQEFNAGSTPWGSTVVTTEQAVDIRRSSNPLPVSVSLLVSQGSIFDFHFACFVVCAAYCERVHTRVHMCYTEARGQSQVSFFRIAHLIFESGSLTGTWRLLISIGWLASEPQKSARLHPPSTETTNTMPGLPGNLMWACTFAWKHSD